jgi:hypothetical protein
LRALFRNTGKWKNIGSRRRPFDLNHFAWTKPDDALAKRMESGRPMDYDDYLREEAAKYRRLAEQSQDDFIKKELLELAVVCEEVANTIEDRLTGG